MKKILLFALPLMVMCAVSCEKDNGNEGNSVQKLVKSFTDMTAIRDLGYPVVNTFEYDENGRVIQLELTGGYGTTTYNVAYEDNMIIETGPHKVIHYLNDDGYVIKTEEGAYSYQTYEYENGKLVKARYYDLDGLAYVYEYQWQGDDIVGISRCDLNSNNTMQYH